MPPSPFVLLWPLALLMDLLTFPQWLYTPLGILLATSIFANLLFPARPALFAILCLLDLTNFAMHSPITPNHAVFHSFVHLAFLLTLLLRCPAHFAPTVRYLTLAVYAVSFFHKLNADFLHPTVSCASELTLTILRRFAMAPSDFSSSIPAWATLFCEFFIPLLLLFPRSIPAALLLAILFHGTLSLVPIVGVYSFSATMLTALAILLPATSLSPHALPPPRRHSLCAHTATSPRAALVFPPRFPRLVRHSPGPALDPPRRSHPPSLAAPLLARHHPPASIPLQWLRSLPWPPHPAHFFHVQQPPHRRWPHQPLAHAHHPPTLPLSAPARQHPRNQ